MTAPAVQASAAGQVALVTGATRGLGKAIASGLAARGATVVLLARDAGAGERVRAEISRATGSPSVRTLVADLADQSSIRAAAAEFERRYEQLNLLVNNAGRHADRRVLTADGIESGFAVNHLAGYLLTRLLLGRLRAGAPARVLNMVSSSVAGSLDPGQLAERPRFEAARAYGEAKLAVQLSSQQLARELRGTGVSVNTFNPVAVGTDMFDEPLPPVLRPLARRLLTPLAPSPERVARSALRLLTGPEYATVTGRCFRWGREVRPRRASLDVELQQRVDELSARLTGLGR